MPDYSSKSLLPWLAALILLAMLFQGSRGLWSPDEGRYTAVALEMLSSGDWLHPHMHPEHPHYSKPPLTYWAIAASIASFGYSEWAVRLPWALAFIGTCLLVYQLGRVYLPGRARLPAVIYATFLLPFAAANAVTTDTLLVLWETLAVTCFVYADRGEADGPRKRMLLLMWTALGLAFLTKGPPGIVPLLPMLAWTAWRRGLPGLRRLLWLPGLLLFPLVALSWYIVAVATTPGLYDYLLQYEFVERVAGSSHGRNSGLAGLFKVYLPTLVIGTLPWGLLLIAAFRRQAPARKRDANNRDFLWWWLLIQFAVFAAAQSRLPLYILPLFVPAALLLAARIEGFFDESQGWGRTFVIAGAIALVAIKLGTAMLENENDDRALALQVGALSPPHYEEIVFVDEKARYGLGFYFSVPVEFVCSSGDCLNKAGRQVDENFAAEIQADRRAALYLLPGRLFERLAGTAALHDRSLTRLGQAGDYLVAHLPAQDH